VSEVEAVVDNLIGAHPAADPSALLSVGAALIRDAAFPPGDGSSTVVLPLG
jgi:hypothetical protein